MVMRIFCKATGPGYNHFIPSAFTLLGIKVVGKKDAGLKNVGGSAIRIIKYALAVMPGAVSGYISLVRSKTRPLKASRH